jgi:AraC family transcriptional activator FtrA
VTATADATTVVAAMVGSAADRVRFAASLRRDLTVQFCADSAELRTLVATGTVDAVVADLETTRHSSVWPTVQAILDPHPMTPVLLWLSLTGKDMRDLVAIASDIKPHAVIIRELDDVSSIILNAIRSARDGSATQRIVQMIERVAPSSVRSMLVFAARHADQPLSVHTMAARAGISQRTLFKRLRDAGLPPARQLIHWLRLLHVAARLDVPKATVEQVVDAMRFASSSTLRHLMKRMTGLTPRQLREAGGLQYLLGVVEPMLSGASPSSTAGEPETPSCQPLVVTSYSEHADGTKRSRI